MKLCFWVLFLVWSSFANANQAFYEYVDSLLAEAVDKGISDSTIDRVKPTLTFRPSVVSADKNQPERKITLDDYLATRVPDWKIKRAIAKLNEHGELLDAIGHEYDVQPRFIVALWGNESNFGKIQGSHPVLSSLASLAFEGRRETLFKTQFFAALSIVEQGHVSADRFNGSWAGAMGQSQFMPATFLSYAVDYNKDGKKDIWDTPADVFASIANFLQQHGWKSDYTWGRQVKLSQPLAQSMVGLGQSKAKPLNDWAALGVTRFNANPLPAVALQSWLIMPDGEQGRIYLVYENFQTLMRWNRSSYFGLSVSYLAERIKKGS